MAQVFSLQAVCLQSSLEALNLETMGAACCSHEVTNMPVEVANAESLSQTIAKGKGKGKSSLVAAPPPPAEGHGKGKGTDHFAHEAAQLLKKEDISTQRPCPICGANGHTAKACPEKGQQKQKRVESVEADMPGIVERLVRVYRESGGNLEQIAIACNCSVEKLRKNPPNDADDFAAKLVRGAYSIPSTRGTGNGWSAASVLGGS